MKHLKLLFALLIATTLLSGCTKDNSAIVTVNETKITRAAFEKEFNNIANNPNMIQQGINLKADPNSPISMIMKARIVDEMIIKALLNKEIEKRHIIISNEELDKAYNDVITTIGSKEQLDDLLKQSNVSLDEYKKALKEDLTYQKLISQLGNFNASNKDIEKFYKENINQFRYPEKVRASHILVKANKEELKAILSAKEENKNLSEADLNKKVTEEMNLKLQKAKKLRTQVLQNPNSFAQVAKDNSDDIVSAKQGGDLSEFAYNDMVEPFSRAAFSMRPNSISDIVVTPYGYHIIFVKDKIKAGIMPLDKVRNEIKNFIEMKQKNEVFSEYIETIRKSAQITYNDETFSPNYIQEQLKKTTLPSTQNNNIKEPTKNNTNNQKK